jgi:aspartyl-tRNA(Asn)/glutamyl-tRNA(Gln) amidotransferase subunit A
MTDEATQLWQLGAGELVAGYQAKAFSPVDVLDALAQRIERLSPALGAFTTLCLERASGEARAAERALGAGRCVASLTGVPFAAKDVFDSAGVRTTYGSPMFPEHVPRRDARAVAAVRAQGGILIGKTQTHEFAWGLTSVNEAMGTARNPWDVELIAGGSSGGSAVALAAHLVPLALGSDTGGSIRVPSSFCGTLGLKPTFGRIDTGGMWPLAPSLDHAGPMARTASDLQLLFGALLGESKTARPIAGTDMRIVICPELNLTPLSRAVENCYTRTLGVLEELGARVEERSLPSASEIVDAFIVIQAMETVQVHRSAGLFPFRAAHYGPDVRARLEVGARSEGREYLAASRAREQIRSEFLRMLCDGAYLLTPVAAVSAPTIRSELSRDESGVDFRSQVIPYTAPQDLLGLPSCAVRCGFDDAGRPIGMQLTAAPWRDRGLLELVEALFEATAEVQASWPLAEAGAATLERSRNVATDPPTPLRVL